MLMTATGPSGCLVLRGEACRRLLEASDWLLLLSSTGAFSGGALPSVKEKEMVAGGAGGCFSARGDGAFFPTSAFCSCLACGTGA